MWLEFETEAGENFIVRAKDITAVTTEAPDSDVCIVVAGLATSVLGTYEEIRDKVIGIDPRRLLEER